MTIFYIDLDMSLPIVGFVVQSLWFLFRGSLRHDSFSCNLEDDAKSPRFDFPFQVVRHWPQSNHESRNRSWMLKMRKFQIIFLVWNCLKFREIAWICLKLVGIAWDWLVAHQWWGPRREIGGSERNGGDRPVPSGLEQRTTRRKQIDNTAREKICPQTFVK